MLGFALNFLCPNRSPLGVGGSQKQIIKFNTLKNNALLHMQASTILMRLPCGGIGIHWPDVDEDISLKGLLKEEFSFGAIAA